MNRIPIAENGYPVKTVQYVDHEKTRFSESKIPNPQMNDEICLTRMSQFSLKCF